MAERPRSDRNRDPAQGPVPNHRVTPHSFRSPDIHDALQRSDRTGIRSSFVRTTIPTHGERTNGQVCQSTGGPTRRENYSRSAQWPDRPPGFHSCVLAHEFVRGSPGLFGTNSLVSNFYTWNRRCPVASGLVGKDR